MITEDINFHLQFITFTVLMVIQNKTKNIKIFTVTQNQRNEENKPSRIEKAFEK